MGDLASLRVSTLLNNTVVVDASMVDPLGRLVDAQLVAASINSVPSLNLQANKGWPLISKNFIARLSLGFKPTSASLKLPINNIPIAETAVQVVCRRVDGTTVNSRPFALKLLVDKYKAELESANKPRQPEKPSPQEPPETQPKPQPSTPPEPSTPLVVQPTDSNRLLNLNKRSSDIRSGILSSEIALGDYKVQKVLVPHARYAPKLFWNEVGNRMIMVGDQTCVIDYPAATDITQYELPGYREWSHVRGDQWLYSDSSRISAIDLADGQTSDQWMFSRTVQPSSLVSSDAWLVRTQNPSQVYLLNEATQELATITLPTHGSTKTAGHEVFVSPDKTQLFERYGDKLSRYSISNDQARLDESARVPDAGSGPAELLACSDAQILLVVSKGKSVFKPQSVVVAYAAQNFTRNFKVEVPDIIRAVVRDAKQGRVIMAGLDKLWFWYPRDGKLQSVPFLRSAPIIDAIALHPQGSTLAVLCGTKSIAPALYWVQLKPSAVNKN